MADKKEKNLTTVKPAITLDATDKLFFALARRDTNTLSYVYALVINKEGASYPANIKTEISTFKTPARANMYFETAQLAMELQKSGMLKQLHELFNGVFEPQINAFNKMASEFKTRTK